MNPKTNKFLPATVDECLHHLDSWDDPSHITHVEKVVWLGRSRSKVLLRKLKHIYRGVDNHFEGSCSISAHDSFSANVVIDYLVKHAGHDILVKVRTRNYVEVSAESWSHRVFTSGGWTHCADHNYVWYFYQRIVLITVVVPLLMVHPLSQQLNWRLCTFFFNLRHIQVIYENYQPLAVGGS